MLDDRMVLELRSVLSAQHHIVQKIQRELESIETDLIGQREVGEKIREAARILDEIESGREFLQPHDLADFDDGDVLQIYSRRRLLVQDNFVGIGYTTWDAFVRDCQSYVVTRGIHPLQPYEVFLTDTDLERLKAESNDAQYRWDKWDYIFVGASGALAALSDFLLVKIPNQMSSTSTYAGQEGSPLTAWLKNYTTDEKGWFSHWAESLESRAKVPYDATVVLEPDEAIRKVGGMYPRSHRFQSLGHDPLLGFVFGVLDIMRGTITGFSYSNLTRMHSLVHGQVMSNLEPIGLIEAILRHFRHLVSDVGTSMGLPAPMMTLLQGINIRVPTSPGGSTVGEIARWMYLNGYDFRHFLVSGITPAVIEIVLRAYLMLRHYSEHGDTEFRLARNPKYRSMLLAAHGVAAAANAGKVALHNGNPLAINYPEWLAFLRYLLPHMKYWLFDKHRLKIEHMEQITEKGWTELLAVNDDLFGLIAASELQIVELGKTNSA